MPHVINDRLVKMVWCSPHPTHYNSYLFEQLRAVESLSIALVYFSKVLIKYPWKTDFISHDPVYYLRKKMGLDWSFILKKVRAHDELLVIAGWNEPTMLLLLVWFSCTGRPFILYSDTPDLRPRKGIRQWFRKKVLRFVFKKVYRFLVTGAPGVQNAITLGIPAERVVNFPFATNTDFFMPAKEMVKKEQKLRFISSGRLDCAHKAYDIAIEAFALLQQQYPEHHFEYRIAGTGPDREILERLIKRKKLEAHIDLIGWLEPSELVSFYQSGEVFLHPSHVDPFPNAVLEAMSCGLPVIGSDAAGSVLDRVKEGENGYIHRSNDVNHLVQKLILMFEQSILSRLEMGKNSRAMAEHWSVSYHIRTIASLVKDYKQTRATVD
jgi:glycosyltransferase involved in cell wall biosynthesis